MAKIQPARSASAILPWLVIFAAAAFLVYAGVRRQQAGEIQIKDVRITLAAKEAIGFRSLQRSLRAPGNATDQFTDAIESSASTPEDEFRIAVLVGDIQGKDRALVRLDRLSRRTITSDLAEDIAAVRRIYADGPNALDPAERERLTAHHDFFAHVALTNGLDPNVEARKEVEQSAARTLVLLSLVALGMLMVVVVSLGFFITAIVLIKKGRIQLAYRTDPVAGSVFLEAFAVYIALFVVFGLGARQLGLANLNWNWLAVLLIPIVMFWSLGRGATADEIRRAFGYHQGRGWYREIAAGLAGYAAGLVFIAIGLAITLILTRIAGAAPQHPIMQMLKGDRWHVLSLYGVACVFAPVLEETMFRGALFHHMRRRHRWLISSTVVAAIFAVIHPQGWAAIPALMIIALVLAAVREWRGSIIAPMAAHACNNFIVLTLALLLLR